MGDSGIAITDIDNLETNLTTGRNPGHTHTVAQRNDHTFTITGTVDARTFPGFYVSPPIGQTATLASCRYSIASGTSIAAKLQKKDSGGTTSDISGFTGIIVTPTPVSTTPSAVALATGDFITLVTSSPIGTPTDLSFTVFIDITFTTN